MVKIGCSLKGLAPMAFCGATVIVVDDVCTLVLTHMQ
jgi:hypothetical protein